MMQVILVRHAETEWNIKGIIQGQSDSALTPRGERQTSALLAAFAASDYRVDCVTRLRLVVPGKWDSAWLTIFVAH